MARVEADVNGNIVRFVTADRESMGNHPQAAIFISFDDESNADLIAELGQSTDNWRLSNGQLRKNNIARQVAADVQAQAKKDVDDFLATAQTMIAANDAFLALRETPNANEVAAQVRSLTHSNTVILRRLVALGKMRGRSA